MDNQQNINPQETEQPKANRTYGELKTNLPKRRGKKVFIIFAILALIAGLAAAGYFVFQKYFVKQSKLPAGIFADLDGQIATQAEFDNIYNAYVDNDIYNKGDISEVDKKAIEKEVANELLLRLALQAEAKKNNISECNQAEVDKREKEKLEASSDKDAYISSKFGLTPQAVKHKVCLDYYEKALANKLISNYNLSGIYIRWDIANGKSDEVKKKVDEIAKKRLENDYLPLFQKGLSTEEILSKADVNKNTSIDEFGKLITSIDNPPTRAMVTPVLNQQTYNTYQQYEEGESEWPYIEKLKPGEFTKPFKSKTGYWVIYRLESKNNAKYGSYDDIRSKYIKDGKVSQSYFDIIKNSPAQSKIRPNIDYSSQKRVTDAIKSFFLGEAKAWIANGHPCWKPFNHDIPFNVSYYDAAAPSVRLPSYNDTMGNSDFVFAESAIGGVKIFDECIAPDLQYYPGQSFVRIDDGELRTGKFMTYQQRDAANQPVTLLDLTCYDQWDFSFIPPPNYAGLARDQYRGSDSQSRVRLSLVGNDGGYFGQDVQKSSDPNAREGRYRVPADIYKTIGLDGYPVVNGQAVINMWIYFDRLAGDVRTTKQIKKSTGEIVVASDSESEVVQSQIRYYNDRKPPQNFFTASGASVSRGPRTIWSKKTDGNYEQYKVTTDVPFGWVVASATYAKNGDPNNKITINAGQKLGNLDLTDCNATSCSLNGVEVDNNLTSEVNFIFQQQIAPEVQGYGPWLQTKNGNVVSSGGIKGQDSGPKLIGSKPNTENEADYLVIAAKPQNNIKGPFCSVYKYILTNVQATAGDCSNGSGYPLNSFALGNSADNDSTIKGVQKAFEELPAACKATALPANINVDKNQCPKGAIFKISNPNGATINNLNLLKGRTTILFDGPLTLDGNTPITYANNLGSNTFTDPKDLPDLAIIVKGDVVINPNVAKLNALIYATGKIDTCQGGPSAACKNQLSVNGSLIAKNGFSFGRTYYNETSRGPAEVVSLNPVSVLFPPPGISNDYFQGYNFGAQIDTAEYQPRF